MSGPLSPADDLMARARAWIASDVDERDREELEGIVAGAASGDPGAVLDLRDRFSGALSFGTAGLRGILGAGESRMNRAVVIRATYGLGQHVLASVPDAKQRGILIGRDGRRGSERFHDDAVEVLAALGFRVHVLPRPSPTPLVAFGARQLGAAAAVVVTASHNPPEYNGYKVYLDGAAQIVPPHDGAIAAEIGRAPAANRVPRLPRAQAGSLVVSAAALEGEYVDAVASLRARAIPATSLRIAYTALHGVGERLFRAAMTKAGFSLIDSVEEQAEPDPAFPTLRFPNPEEPGALDRVLALARRTGADLVLANDPDADRLAVAVPNRQGEYRALTGNEIGVLLGHHVLTREPEAAHGALVVTTIVSSRQLARIARDLGARYAETLTGFKWIAHRAREEEARSGARFLFGYEEALGYTVGGIVRDKDGIGASVVFAELAAESKARGETVLERLERIQHAHGYYASRQRSLALSGRDGKERARRIVDALRELPASALAGMEIEHVRDLEAQTKRSAGGRIERLEELPKAEGIILELSGGRIAVRPSGTEPKLKFYLEVHDTLAEGEPSSTAKARTEARLDALWDGISEVLTIDRPPS